MVVAAGPDAELFKVGDEVFYAGHLKESGSYTQFQTVDERVVGRKPKSISHADAASLPLTSLTAYETLYEGMGIFIKGQTEPTAVTHETTAPVVVVVAGAGGVGSVAIQLLRALTPDATVIATASRPETQAWVTGLGAHHHINHHKNLKEQLAVRYYLCVLWWCFNVKTTIWEIGMIRMCLCVGVFRNSRLTELITSR